MPHVTFIHGIANKPSHDVLLRLWRDSLARGDDGVDLGGEGVTSSMVYWADVLYEEPQAEQAEHESNDSIVAKEDADLDFSWQTGLESSEAEWMKSLSERLEIDRETPPDGEDFAPPDEMEEMESNNESVALERIPLPWWLKKRLMEGLLRDVHHYLFNSEMTPRPGGPTFRVQDEIRGRMIAALAEGADKHGPHIVVSHSMGTVIAYDCLKRVGDCSGVDGLITIGSPLGIDEIQDKLRPEWSRENGFPEKVGTDWVNVYDRLDPVAGFDPNIANDYRSNGADRIRDINEQNYGRWRHNISNYLEGTDLRGALSQMLDL